MLTKICSKCKIEKHISEFHRDKTRKDGRVCWCKKCVNKKSKRHYQNNKKKHSKQMRQWYKNNPGYDKQYQIKNKEKISKRKKQHYIENKEKTQKQNKQQYTKNRENRLKQRKEYYENNQHKCINYIQQWRLDNLDYNKKYTKSKTPFNTFAKKINTYEKIRKSTVNKNFLETTCAYCGQWFIPSISQIQHRIQSINGIIRGEHRLYCSENCKQACPIYQQKKYPRSFKQATSREVVPLLRQLILKRDNWTCQKCGATTETAQLHVHHIIPYAQNKMQANDPDSCITLCKFCHEEIHKQDGCKYSDLKCKN